MTQTAPEKALAPPKVYVGVKWGLMAPTVMLAAKFYPPPRDHIHLVRELYREEMLLEDLIKVGKEWKEELEIRKFFCDPTQPEFISRMRKARLWAWAVEQETNLAINIIKRRLANFVTRDPYSIAASPDCPEIIKEFPKFHMVERKKNQPVKDKPLDVDNYALSALQFLVVGLASERTPQVRWI